MNIPSYEDETRMSARLMWSSAQGRYDGTMRTAPYLNRCRALLKGPEISALVIFTLDEGMHACGWWKNPDYERCKHMSVSFVSTETLEPAPHDKERTDHLARLMFGGHERLSWWEPPFSDEGKHRNVWHVRVFYAPGFSAPILPRGEVYTRDFTEAGWKSWSDLHGDDGARMGLQPGPGEQ